MDDKVLEVAVIALLILRKFGWAITDSTAATGRTISKFTN